MRTIRLFNIKWDFDDGTDPGQAPEVKLDVVTQDNLEEYVRDDMADAMFVPTMLPDDILSKLFG